MGFLGGRTLGLRSTEDDTKNDREGKGTSHGVVKERQKERHPFYLQIFIHIFTR